MFCKYSERKVGLVWKQITKENMLKSQGTLFRDSNFQKLSLVQIVVVPPEETDISKLLTALFIFIRPPLFESWFGDLVCYKERTYGHPELKETKNITHFLLLKAHRH